MTAKIVTPGPWSLARRTVGRVGGFAQDHWQEWQYLAAVLGSALFLSAQPRRWRRTVRAVFARQLLLFGVDSIRFILVLAVLVGVSIVVQLDVWAEKLGQSRKLGPLLV